MEDIFKSSTVAAATPPTLPPPPTSFQLFTPAFHHPFHRRGPIDGCWILIHRVIYKLSRLCVTPSLASGFVSLLSINPGNSLIPELLPVNLHKKEGEGGEKKANANLAMFEFLSKSIVGLFIQVLLDGKFFTSLNMIIN